MLKIGDSVVHKTLGTKWNPVYDLPGILVSKFWKWVKVRYGRGCSSVGWFRIEELEHYYSKEEREAYEQIFTSK